MFGEVGREMEVVELAVAGEGESGSGGSSGGGEAEAVNGVDGVNGRCSSAAAGWRLLMRSSKDGRAFNRGLPNPSIRYGSD